MRAGAWQRGRDALGTLVVGPLRRHPGLAAALAANLLLLLLPFYDPNNLPEALSITSHFTNATPSAVYNGWVAGLFIYAYWVPMHLAYVASGFRLYAAYTAVKAISFAMTVWLAYALYRVAKIRRPSIALPIAVASVANPVWLFVNYVWVQYDVLPAAFLAVGFLLLQFPDELGRPARTAVVGVLLLSVSIFFYWIALALVPTLLIFARSHRERLELVGWGALALGALLGIMLAGVAPPAGTFSQALVGGNPLLNRSAFFGVQYFVKFPLDAYLALLGLIGIGVPIAARFLRFSATTAAFSVLTLFLATNTIPTPDNYAFLVPFAALAYLEFPRVSRWLGGFWALLALPIATLLLFNLWVENVQPDGAGFFLWGFDIFRTDVIFLTTAAAISTYLTLYNIVLVGAVVGSLTVLFAGDPRTTPTNLPAGSASAPWRAPLRGRAVVGVTAVLAVGVAVAVLFNGAVPNLIQYHGQGEVPVEAMLPTYLPPNGNAVRPIPGYTYGLDGSTIQIYRGAPAFDFSRWTGPDRLALSGSETLVGVLPRWTPVVDLGIARAAVVNESLPDPTRATLLSPAQTNGSAPPANSTLPGTEGARAVNATTTSIYQFDGASWTGGYYEFAFQPAAWGPDPTFVAFLKGPHAVLVVAAGPANLSGVIYTGWMTQNATLSQGFGLPIPLGLWSYVVLHPTARGIGLELDGSSLTVPFPFFATGPVEMYLGLDPFGGSAGYALLGNRTPLAELGEPYPQFTNLFGELNGSSPGTLQPLAGTTFTFSFAIDPRSGSLLNIFDSSFVSNRTALGFSLGKLVEGPYGILLRIDRFTIDQVAPAGPYLLPVYVGAVGPFAALLLLRRRWGRHEGSRSLS